MLVISAKIKQTELMTHWRLSSLSMHEQRNYIIDRTPSSMQNAFAFVCFVFTSRAGPRATHWKTHKSISFNLRSFVAFFTAISVRFYCAFIWFATLKNIVVGLKKNARCSSSNTHGICTQNENCISELIKYAMHGWICSEAAVHFTIRMCSPKRNNNKRKNWRVKTERERDLRTWVDTNTVPESCTQPLPIEL